MSVFGNVVTPHEVTESVEKHIRLWQRSYMDHIATGRGFSRRLPSIRSYRHTNQRPEKWPEDQLPCVVIVSEDAEPYDRGAEGIAMDFPVAVAVIDSSATQDATNKLVQARAAALSQLILEKPGLPAGEAHDWGGFTFGEEPPERERTLGIAMFGFVVRVPDALVIGPGPAVPLPDPDPDDPAVPPDYGDTPTADTVTVTTTHIDEEA